MIDHVEFDALDHDICVITRNLVSQFIRPARIDVRMWNAWPFMAAPATYFQPANGRALREGGKALQEGG
jgi:hypothetical protein